MTTVWAPASQESSHVGHAGVGVVSLPTSATAQSASQESSHVGHAGVGVVSLPTSATAQFKLLFFDCGRAVRCMLPLGCGRFLHLVVLYEHQGTDREAEKLALTDQLLDTGSGELGVVSRE